MAVSCTDCGASFSNQSGLRRHYRKLRPCSPNALPSEAAHVCDACKKSFSRVDTLKRHKEGYCGNPPPPRKEDPKGLEIAQQIAKERNGECLSQVYVGRHAHMRWRCNLDGTEWDATLANIKNHDRWCPSCGSHKNERRVRECFQLFTGKPFPETSGLFPDNPRLKLDGYCQELGIAFEYHGEQHYYHIPYFHRDGTNTLKRQWRRDRYVEETAPRLEEPIALIVIPYSLPQKLRPDFIWNKLKQLGAVDDT